MSDENVHQMWSDDDLDTALATLRSDVDTQGPALGNARAELMRAADPTGTASPPAPAPSRPHWSRWAAAAAAVLVAGVFALQQGRAGVDDPHRPATTHKQDVANRIGAVDAPQRPGRFRYVGTHLWGIAQSEKYAYLAEILTETWVPGQVRADWLQQRSVSGKRKWIFGTETDAKSDGGLHMWTGGTWHAPCGAFGQETGFARCDAKGAGRSRAPPSSPRFRGIRASCTTCCAPAPTTATACSTA